MAKKRKTREQKRLADSRHSFTHTRVYTTSSSYELKPKFSTKIEAKTIVVPQNNYPYLKKDLSKTALITLGILIFQAVLFAVLKNHLLVFPGLNY